MSDKKPKPISLESLMKARNLREPGEAAVRSAVRYFRMQEARKPLAAGRLQVLFDSFAEPLPAGVRSVGTADRRLLVSFDRGGSGTLQLDLQVRRESPEHAVIVGQILPPSAGAIALLMEGANIVANCAAEPSGEFSLEYRGIPAEPISLRLQEPGRKSSWDVPSILVRDHENE